MNEKIDEALKCLAHIEKGHHKIMSQLEDLDTKLDAVAAAETKLGTDIKTVIAAIKNLPGPTPPDLTAQLAKLDAIAQTLQDTDAETLANLSPAP